MMQFECKGQINRHSNISAPQVSKQGGKMKKYSVWPIVRKNVTLLFFFKLEYKQNNDVEVNRKFWKKLNCITV